MASASSVTARQSRYSSTASARGTGRESLSCGGRRRGGGSCRQAEQILEHFQCVTRDGQGVAVLQVGRQGGIGGTGQS